LDHLLQSDQSVLWKREIDLEKNFRNVISTKVDTRSLISLYVYF
jgi:hypothetical protein